MPIEIKELHIRVSVSPESGAAKAAGTAGDGAVQQTLVAECVEQVMQLLRDQKDR